MIRPGVPEKALFTRWQWLLFLAVLLVVLAWARDQQPVMPEACHDAHRLPCPDLLGADVRIRYHDSKVTLTPLCGDVRSTGCALRSVRWREAVCDVHLLQPASELLLLHEMNHCRGWEHDGDSQAAYARPWLPNGRLIRSRGRWWSHQPATDAAARAVSRRPVPPVE